MNQIICHLPDKACRQRITIPASSQTKRYLAEIHGSVRLWHEQLKTIEGNFGQNVGLYFRFMRWLLIVNMEVLLIRSGELEVFG